VYHEIKAQAAVMPYPVVTLVMPPACEPAPFQAFEVRGLTTDARSSGIPRLYCTAGRVYGSRPTREPRRSKRCA